MCLKKHNVLDKNYFLSYGYKIKFLLLPVAAGTPNTKLISVMRAKPELSYSADIKNYPQVVLADVFVYMCSEAKNIWHAINRLFAHKKGTHTFYDKKFLYNLFSFNKIKLGAISNKLIYSCQKTYGEYLYDV